MESRTAGVIEILLPFPSHSLYLQALCLSADPVGALHLNSHTVWLGPLSATEQCLPHCLHVRHFIDQAGCKKKKKGQLLTQREGSPLPLLHVFFVLWPRHWSHRLNIQKIPSKCDWKHIWEARNLTPNEKGQRPDCVRCWRRPCETKLCSTLVKRCFRASWHIQFSAHTGLWLRRVLFSVSR